MRVCESVSHLYAAVVVQIAVAVVGIQGALWMDGFHLCPVSSYYQTILLPVTYSLVFVLGLALNAAMLWSVCCGTRTRTRSSNSIIYLTNLSVADLLYVFSLPPLIISNAMRGAWPFGNVVCKAVRFFFFLNLHCSMMFLTCVSVHRFLGVCFPIAAVRLRSKKLAVFVSGTVWVLATVEIFPVLVFAHTGPINNVTVCFEMTNPAQFKLYFPYGMFLTVVGFLIPFVIVLVCYCSIMKVLLRKARDASHPRAARLRNKSLRTLLVVCLLFVLCFAPYHVARTVYLFVRVYMAEDCRLLNVVMIAFKAWDPVVSLNCCVNPLLYFWSSDRHRRRLRAWVGWRRTRIQPGPVCVFGLGCTNRIEGVPAAT